MRVDKCTCTMQSLLDGSLQLVRCPSCSSYDRDPLDCEIDALRVRVMGLERALDALVHACEDEVDDYGSMNAAVEHAITMLPNYKSLDL